MRTRIITLVLLSVVTILFNSCIVRETEIVTSDDEMTEKYVGMTVEEVCRRIGEPEKRCSFIQDSIEITELTFRNIHVYFYPGRSQFLARDGRRPYIKVYFRESDGRCYCVKTNLTKEFRVSWTWKLWPFSLTKQNPIDVFCRLLAFVLAVVAVLFLKFAGEKYMSLTLMTRHPEKYDLKKFKIVYSACLFAYAAICIFIATTGIYNSFRWIVAPIVLTWILFFTWCKK